MQAQTDNFNSGSDAVWQKSTTAGYPATFSFVPDVLGGQAYRLQAETPLDYATAGQVNDARAIAVRTDQTYTSFYVAADLVGWDTRAYDSTNNAVIGLIARASNITTTNELQGLMLLTHWNQYDNAQRGTAQIYAILQGGAFLVPACQGNFTIERGHSYRMVFAGTNNVLVGKFYDLTDLTHPLLTLIGDDTYAPGFFPASGYSGLIALGYRGGGDINATSADATFDNFVASAVPPTSVVGPGTPHGLVGTPQVVNRLPVSYANFYAPAGGITFNATTLTTTNPIDTSSIRLYLNDVNCSSALTVSGQATNASVSYSGLASNTVYEARIELQDALGHKTTNTWTFDTFTDAYLASAVAKIIECEEYDFSGGQYFNNPTVSGYTTNSTPVNVGSPNTYADQVGVNANTNGVAVPADPPYDFFDNDKSARTGDNEFRAYDPIGTQNGSAEYQYAFNGELPTWRGFDNLRQKYLTVQPDGSLVESGVERTEAGEWLNYTRGFDGSKSYNVYLRHGCALTQSISLDQIGAGPTTNNLGTFSCVNALTRSNFRYAPLRDSAGNLAVVNLTGVNTIRLTLASTNNAVVKQGMWMNYLAFVPAVPVAPKLYSSATVNGAYAEETGAVVNTTSKTITVPLSGATRFYRVAFTSQLTISGLTISGSNVVLTYQ
ncbi:MAG: hypothetical protein IT579_08130 [Verrucomicrobia subdivision 3 bacterium]|nr:hypothetical protein [Limisphaerales bacterium]